MSVTHYKASTHNLFNLFVFYFPDSFDETLFWDTD